MKTTNTPGKRIIFAWDTSEFGHKEKRLLASVIPRVGVIKIGLEAMNAFMPDGSGTVATETVKHIRDHFGTWVKIMWDQKILDILNTQARAVSAAKPQGFWGITVHASSGVKGLEACVSKSGEMMIIGVTLPTDFDRIRCRRVFNTDIQTKLTQFASDIAQAHCPAMVCAASDIEHLRNARETRVRNMLEHITIITPGIRPAFASKTDQKRVSSPAEAIKAGADFLVIGRAISNTTGISASDAISRIEEEISMAEK